ncbi:MAG: RdgB/HAM1 family non-canonical purine NTP pyrophosphatase, partial [Steroidobacteraceae bacterium]
PVEETGATFTDNALLKARNASQAAGLAALSDDSGIEVDALGGRPGVRSARYAGEGATDRQNLDKLLAALSEVPAERRTARYRCVIAFVASPADPQPVLAAGCWEGRIATAPRGGGGFGYDPIFLPREAGGRTAAELVRAEKDTVSHRAQALAALVEKLGGPGSRRSPAP